MEGLQLLAVSLAVLFGFGMIFSLLLWCRSWRKEDREQTDQQIRALRASIKKLIESVELLDHTAAALQTADGLLTQQLEDLKSSITQFQGIRSLPGEDESETFETAETSTISEKEAVASQEDINGENPTQGSTAYNAVSDLLGQGKPTLEVARELDIGLAEVRMIARMRTADTKGTA